MKRIKGTLGRQPLVKAAEAETQAMKDRLAKRLLAGETYESIRKQIPVSSATITRVNTALQFGSGGYRTVLEKREK